MLSHKDVLWIREDSEPADYPWFPNITQEQIDKWSDGWYGVLRKSYLPDGRLELTVLEIHGSNKCSLKNPFYDCDYL